MNRKILLTFMSLLLVALMASACGALNRALPEEADAEAMEADVRAAIATAVPGKTFAIEVKVSDDRTVTLSGHVENASDRDAIVAAVRRVDGVRAVDARGLHVG